MPDDINLRNLWNAFEIVIATQFGWQNIIRDGHVQLRQTITDTPALRTLENETLILGWVLCDFLNAHKNNSQACSLRSDGYAFGNPFLAIDSTISQKRSSSQSVV